LGTDQSITLTPSGTGWIVLQNYLQVSHSASNSYFGNASALLVSESAYDTGIRSDGSAIVFGFGDSVERLRLGSNGNLGIGKTPGANAQLDVAKSIISGLNVVTFSATPMFDASLGNTQKITLTDNVTSSTLSNATAGETISFIICQDATGSRTFVWPTNVLGGMTIGATLSKCSAQNFIFDGTNAYALSAGVTNM
jgi:hypothetical protein